MSENASDIAKKNVVYQMPGTDDVIIRRDLEYSAAGSRGLTMDMYNPPAQVGEPLPAVIIVAGYPDPGVARIAGRKFKEMGSSAPDPRLLAV